MIENSEECRKSNNYMELIRRKRRTCRKCNEPLSFGASHAWCNECKRLWYKENKYGYRNRCVDCKTPSRLKHGKCKVCLSKIGLRWCDGCKNMLILALSFYSCDRSNKCKECRKKRVNIRQIERAKLL